jgi:hypothetical protein
MIPSESNTKIIFSVYFNENITLVLVQEITLVLVVSPTPRLDSQSNTGLTRKLVNISKSNVTANLAIIVYPYQHLPLIFKMPAYLFLSIENA